jgi:hypothetical protein
MENITDFEKKNCWSWTRHRSGYEQCYPLGYDPVQPYTSLLTFRRNILLSFLLWDTWRTKNEREPRCKSQSQSRYDWRSVSWSVLVSSPMWGSWPVFYLFIYLFCESFSPVNMGRPLWREFGSVACQSVICIKSLVSMYMRDWMGC